jgi:hypothetical protein
MLQHPNESNKAVKIAALHWFGPRKDWRVARRQIHASSTDKQQDQVSCSTYRGDLYDLTSIALEALIEGIFGLIETLTRKCHVSQYERFKTDSLFLRSANVCEWCNLI